MRKSITVLLSIFVLCLSFVLAPSNEALAATFKDGTYDIPFELKESGNNNTSIADGYFKKPAKLIVKNGKSYVQITTTESDWVKSISGPNGAATVISEGGNHRTVQFQVGSLANAVNLKMHIVVPKEIAGMEYDHNHSVRAVFNTSSVPVATGGNAGPTKADKTENSESIANPKTGDSSTIGLYVALLVLSIGGLTFLRKRTANS